MKSLVKNIFFALVPKPRLPDDRAVILMYHSISATPDYFSSITPTMFARQMEYMAEKKYSVISLQELVRRIQDKEPLRGSVVITFDDGYRDNYEKAFPVLKKYNFPATIFVTTSLIGHTDKRGLVRLREEEIKELQASSLIAIEPHTKTHPKLSKLSVQEARQEIEESKYALEQLLGIPCNFFASPYGDFNNETLASIKTAGFTAHVTVEEGTVRPAVELFHMPRVSIDRSSTMAQFRGKLSIAVDWYEKLKIWR